MSLGHSRGSPQPRKGNPAILSLLNPSSGRGGVFYGWWIVLACLGVVTLTAGVSYYGFSAFVTPLAFEFGWSRVAISGAFSLRGLEGGTLAPVVGVFIDRIGPRRVMLFGVVGVGLGLILMSRVNSLVGLYAAYAVVAMSFSACSGRVGFAAVANWFIRKRGKALGIASTGAAFSGSIPLLLVWLIATYGWRTTLLVEAAFLWAIGIPLCLLVRNKPEEYGYLPDGVRREINPPPPAEIETDDKPKVMQGAVGIPEPRFAAREALKTRGFWLISFALSLQAMVTSGLFLHLIPYFTSIGFGTQLAALAMTITTLMSLMGRLGFGWLGDLMDKRHAMAIALALTSVGLFILAGIKGPWQLVPFFMTFSLGYAGVLPLRGAIQGEYYGRRAFATIQGFIAGVIMLGSVSGPILAGWIYDVTGSYRQAWVLASIVPLLAIPLTLAAKPPLDKSKPL